MLTVYCKVEGGVFEPYAAMTDEASLVGQEVTVDWIDYDEYEEGPLNHCQEKLTVTLKPK